jgi:diacylglycerol kinase family enzyme
VLTALRARGWRVRAAESRDLADVESRVAAVGPGELVAVLGGDGTLGRAAAGAFQSGAVLAPLPGGRGNDFCRVLGVARDPVRAVATLPDPGPDERPNGWDGEQLRRVDLGVAGSRIFVCVAHAGFDSVANDIANSTPVLRGTPVYLYAALRAIAGWHAATFTLEDGHGLRRHVGWTVAFGNAGMYGGGMNIAPHARRAGGDARRGHLAFGVPADPAESLLRSSRRTPQGVHSQGRGGGAERRPTV